MECRGKRGCGTPRPVVVPEGNAALTQPENAALTQPENESLIHIHLKNILRRDELKTFFKESLEFF